MSARSCMMGPFLSHERHVAQQHRSSIIGIEAVSLSSNRSFPRHAHDQFGVGVIRTGAHRSWSGVGPVEASAGDIITVNPGEMHDGSAVQGRVRSWQMLYIEPTLLNDAIRAEWPATAEIAHPALHDPPLAALFVRLFRGITAPQPDALAVEEDLVRVLASLVGRYGTRPARRGGSPPHVARAMRRLDEAPDRPVTLAELAALSDVSRFQLLRGFARAVGTTPHAYLVQCRVRLARRLLASGLRPADAALAAGFADQSHMTRTFVRQLGVTPARYRAAVL